MPVTGSIVTLTWRRKPVLPWRLLAFSSGTLARYAPTHHFLWRNLAHTILGKARGHHREAQYSILLCGLRKAEVYWPRGETPALPNYALRKAHFQGPRFHPSATNLHCSFKVPNNLQQIQLGVAHADMQYPSVSVQNISDLFNNHLPRCSRRKRHFSHYNKPHEPKANTGRMISLRGGQLDIQFCH